MLLLGKEFIQLVANAFRPPYKEKSVASLPDIRYQRTDRKPHPILVLLIPDGKNPSPALLQMDEALRTEGYEPNLHPLEPWFCGRRWQRQDLLWSLTGLLLSAKYPSILIVAENRASELVQEVIQRAKERRLIGPDRQTEEVQLLSV